MNGKASSPITSFIFYEHLTFFICPYLTIFVSHLLLICFLFYYKSKKHYGFNQKKNRLLTERILLKNKI